MNRIFLPNGQLHQTKESKQLQARLDSVVDDARETYISFVNRLVTECVKDLNGGILPPKKKLKRDLTMVPGPNGKVFFYKGRPMLLILNPKFGMKDGKEQMQVAHKKLYVDEPQEPVAASN